jgi:hypothetical protein
MPLLQSPSIPVFALAYPTFQILLATMALPASVSHTPHGPLSARFRYQKSAYYFLFFRPSPFLGHLNPVDVIMFADNVLHGSPVLREIEDIFLDLTQKFGFQRDSMRNMFDFLMQLLDSRASRMSPNQALLTLHADYIGGQHANYRKWYFAAQLDLDDAIGQVQNPGLQRLKSTRGKGKGVQKTGAEKSLESALGRWRQAMNNMSQYDRLRQIALFLLCWGEAAQVRFVPECLCFIFKCADDYYRSPECQNRVEPVPEGLYLRAVIKPLYRQVISRL